MESYQFTNDWFDKGTKGLWDHIIPQLKPRKILEIHCVDTWEGGIERLPYGTDPLRCPKPAIDAFINLNIRKLTLYPGAMLQIYVQKVAE